jgi:hypothetical protein
MNIIVILNSFNYWYLLPYHFLPIRKYIEGDKNIKSNN